MDTEVDAVSPDDPDEIFRVQVRQRRTALGWSQQRLTDELVKLGYPWHQTTVAKVEAGQRRLSLGEATALARVLGGSLAEMASESVADMDTRIRDLRHQERILMERELEDIEKALSAAHEHAFTARSHMAEAHARLNEAERTVDELKRARNEVVHAIAALDVMLRHSDDPEPDPSVRAERDRARLELAKIAAAEARSNASAHPRHGSVTTPTKPAPPRASGRPR